MTPQGRVSDGSTTGLLDDVVGYGWTVLSTRPEVVHAVSPDVEAWAKENGVRILTVGGEGLDLQDMDGTYKEWFSELETEVAIIRPGFYLYDAVPLAGLDQTLSRLRDLLAGDARPAVAAG